MASIDQLLGSCQRHGLILWAFLPLFALSQWLIEAWRPTCERGYLWLTLLVVALVVGHHLLAESHAWAAAKALLARPELTIMHHLGVLRRRRRLVLLGVLEDLDIYTDFTFPLVARSCEMDKLQLQWLKTWGSLPWIGEQVVSVLKHLHFWGLSAVLVSLVCLLGLSGIVWQAAQRGSAAALLGEDGQKPSPDQLPRLGGRVFFGLAQAADNAAMPSVALLCEEMARQRRWCFDAKFEAGGALERTKMGTAALLGRIDRKTLERHELFRQQERENVDAAGKMYAGAVLLGKTFLGNALQLSVQAAFFELSFSFLGAEACGKLLVGMAISALQVVVRSVHACTLLGCCGLACAAPNLALVAWSGAKIYFAYACPDHVWSLFTSCIAETNGSLPLAANVTG